MDLPLERPVLLNPDKATIDALEALERAIFPVPWEREDFVSAFENDLYDVVGILEDGKPVAYAVICTVCEDCDLQNLAVRPDRRGRGGGDELLLFCAERARARGAARMFLEVRESNRPARALYEKHGFIPYGRRKNYYARPTEDAILCLKAL